MSAHKIVAVEWLPVHDTEGPQNDRCEGTFCPDCGCCAHCSQDGDCGCAVLIADAPVVCRNRDCACESRLWMPRGVRQAD